MTSNKEFLEFSQDSYLDCEKYDELYRQLQMIVLKYKSDRALLSLLKLEDSKRSFQEALYELSKKSTSP